MIPARARKAFFASAGFGNAAATSGSSAITALPAAYRDAYLLREARLEVILRKHLVGIGPFGDSAFTDCSLHSSFAHGGLPAAR